MTLGHVICLLAAGVGVDLRTDDQSRAAAHEAAVAKAQTAHAKLRTIQRQLATVDATMAADMNNFLDLSRQQDEKDAREELGASSLPILPSSFVETSPSLIEKSKAKGQVQAEAHAKLAQIQKQLASVNAKMQADMENVMQISHEQDEEDMHAALPSSFVETGKRADTKGYPGRVPQDLQTALDKLHAVEGQMRRQDQQYQLESGTAAYPGITLGSFLETPGGLDGPDELQRAVADQDAQEKADQEEMKEVMAERRAMAKHKRERVAEYAQEHPSDQSDDADDESLLELSAHAHGAPVSAALDKARQAYLSTTAFLETAVKEGKGTPKVEAALKHARQQEAAWEQKFAASTKAKLAAFDAKFNAKGDE